MSDTNLLKLNTTKPTASQLRTAFRSIVADDAILYRLPDGGIKVVGASEKTSRLVDKHAAEVEWAVTPSISPEDAASARRLLNDRAVELVIDDKRAAEVVPDLIAAANKTGVLAFDTETTPIERRPIPVALTKDGRVAVRQPKTGDAGAALDPRRARMRLIQAYAGDGPVMLFDMDATSWNTIEPLLHDVPALAAFNAVFDCKMLIEVAGIEPTTRLYDTMTACRLIDGSRDGLGKTAANILGIDLPKELGASDWGRPDLSADQVNYAALDAVVTFDLWAHQRDLFDEVDENAQSIADETIIATARMELHGLPFDKAAHAAKVQHWQEERRKAEVALSAATGGQLTGLPTNRQVAAYLVSVLDDDDLEDWPKTRTGTITVAAPALKNNGDGVPGVAELLTLRAWAKALSTYGPTLSDAVDDDERLRSSFLIAGARTGRYASRNVNLQNQPKRNPLLAGFRDIFRAPEGYKVVAADFSQIELRIAAELSGDKAMTEAFATGTDLHIQTAERIHGRKIDKKDPERSQAKAASFGLLYGSGARGFRRYAKTIGVTLTHGEAVDLIDNYFTVYPDLHRWQINHTRETRRRGVVETVGGRRWQFRWRSHSYDDPKIDELEEWQVADWIDGYERNFALNHPVQGTAAEIIGVALNYVDQALRPYDARIGAIVHDELVVVTHDDDIDDVKRILAAKMGRAWLEFFPDAPRKGIVDISVAQGWED